MKPKEKVEHIRKFCIALEKFEEKNPGFCEDMDYFFINLPPCDTITPFHRLVETDTRILNLLKRQWKALLKKLYLTDWTFVKVISFESFFVEHLNIVDTKYETLYNLLWEDILYTEMLIPSVLKMFDRQTHFYLKK